MRRIACLAILSLIMIAAHLVAAPHSFLPIEATQPDGSKISIYASGDEFHNWLHDGNNYTIVKDESGAYVYAMQERGSLVASDLLVGRDLPNMRNLTPGLNLSPDEIRAKYDRYADMRDYSNARAPHTGQLNNVVIFIKFSDSPNFSTSFSTYQQIFNSTTDNSMKRYFQAASYNQLNVDSFFYPAPSGDVVLSYTDSYPRSYFQPYDASTNPNGYSGDDQRTQREHALLKRAVDAVSSQIPTTLNIDGDNDGYVDNVCFIIQGAPDGWAELLWPHMWALYSNFTYINNKRVYDFNFQLETSLNNSGAGVLSHEMFHSLGAPDLYRYEDRTITPVGRWDLMATNLNPPQHMSAWMKHKYGQWISNVPTITTSGTYTLSPVASSSTNNIYRIDSWKEHEYYLLEYRKSDGTYDGNLQGTGLLVYRLDTREEGNAHGPPDELYIYRPGGTNSVDGNLYQAHFSQQSGRTELSEATTPNGFLGDGSAGGLNLFDIGYAGDTISFKVKISDIQLTFPHGGEVWQSGANKVITWKSKSSTGNVKLDYSSDGGQSWNLITASTSNSGSYTWDNVPYMDNSQNVHVRVSLIGTSHSDSNYYPFTVGGGGSATEVVLGTGTSSNGTATACPINVYHKSLHGQSIYTAAELNAAGVTGPIRITQIGFNVTGLPASAMPNFVIRMGHTAATDVSSWISTGLTQVWSSVSYQPTATGWNMYTLSTPFLWNGTDNIVVDTAFSLISSRNASGTTQYTNMPNGYRFTRDDDADQTNVFSGGATSNLRPNLKLVLLPLSYEVIIGSGTESTGGYTACPVNIYYKSLHGQSVYTAAELNAVGVYGPINITKLGFNITGLPSQAMPNYVVRMGHTSATDVSNWITTGFTQVWSSASFQPEATGWNLFVLPTPFEWNGVDNIVVDTAFGLTGSWSPSGTTQYTNVTNGYRFVRSDSANQTHVFSGGEPSNYRPNLRLTLQELGTPAISIDNNAISANLQVGTEGTDSFTITNSGYTPLTFNINMEELTGSGSSRTSEKASGQDRSIAGSTLTLDATDYLPGATVDWTFTVYNASTSAEWLKDVIITFPAGVTVNSTTNFVGGGGGELTPNVSSGNGVTITWHGENSSGFGLIHGGQSASATVNVTISPSFSGDLSLPWTINGDGWSSEPHTLYGSIVLTQDLPPIDWLTVQPLSGSIAVGGSVTVTANFSAVGMAVGSYAALLTISSNDPDNPSLNVNASMDVWDSIPTPVITAITKINGGFRINWNAVEHADSYEVWRATDPYGTFERVSSNISGLTYEDLTELPMAFYYIKAIRN